MSIDAIKQPGVTRSSIEFKDSILKCLYTPKLFRSFKIQDHSIINFIHF